MSLLGKGIMATWIEVKSDLDDFHEWHTREHMPERLGIGGFMRGRRYIAIEGGVPFFIFYETRDIDVLSSAEYLGHLNKPTPWSMKVVHTIGKNLRGVCDVRFTNGYSAGGFLATVRFDVPSGDSAPFEEPLRASLAQPNIVAAHLLVCNKEKSGTKTTLQSMRTIELPDHVVLIEGCAAKSVADATHALMRQPAFAGVGNVQIDLYQLECTTIPSH